MAHNNVCTQVRTSVYGRGRGLQGPVGVGWCACDMINIINHVQVHLVGFGGVGWVSVGGSLDPVGRSQRSQCEPA